MSTLRLRERASKKMLYIASGLVTLVILSIIIWIIPHVINDPTPQAVPEYSAPALWLLAGIHLIILLILIAKIILGHRHKGLSHVKLSIPGIILILIGLPLLDAAVAYQDHDPDMPGMVFILTLCVLFDILAGIIAIVIPSGVPQKPDN